nr:DUF998 domain-containing protein [Micromonospora sp. DSM 115978]
MSSATAQPITVAERAPVREPVRVTGERAGAVGWAAGLGARPLAAVVLAGAVLAAVLTVWAHVGSAPDLDALSLTISDFAVSNRGGPMDRAMFVLGATSLALPLGLRAVRAPVGRLPILLLLVWCFGLMAAAIVPTDPDPLVTQLTTRAYVHRYVSVAAFVSLPVAVLVAARRLGADPRWRSGLDRLRALAWASVVGLVALWLVAFPGERVMMGLVQRLLVTVEVVLLAVFAAKLHRVAGVPESRQIPSRDRRNDLL